MSSRKAYVSPMLMCMDMRLLPVTSDRHREGIVACLDRVSRRVGVRMFADSMLAIIERLDDERRFKARERWRLKNEGEFKPWPLEELAKVLADPGYVPTREPKP